MPHAFFVWRSASRRVTSFEIRLGGTRDSHRVPPPCSAASLWCAARSSISSKYVSAAQKIEPRVSILRLFSKRLVSSNELIRCNGSLLAMPPEDLFDVQTTIRGRRGAFMICALTSMYNDAAVAACPTAERVPRSRCLRLTSPGMPDSSACAVQRGQIRGTGG